MFGIHQIDRSSDIFLFTFHSFESGFFSILPQGEW